MILSQIPRGDSIEKHGQVSFAGLDARPGAGDGALRDMKNLTGDLWPIIAVRPRRRTAGTTETPNGIFSHGELLVADGTDLYFGGEKVEDLALEDSRKQFASIGDLVIILPDKVWFDTVSGEHGSLESVWTGNTLCFQDGLLFDEYAEENCIYASGTVWSNYFKPGDGVTIEGCSVNRGNNKTAVIREIDGDKLYFSEYCFDNGTETGELSISRLLPELRYICENANRLWGCDGRTIYASKLGDPFNWNVFDGVETDSWAWDPGGAGDFTGCCSYLGYPCFFRQDSVFKVYGSMPSNFEAMGGESIGVLKGASGSLALAGGVLFYLSPAGFMAYTGGQPRSVQDYFGTERFISAQGASDGIKYYVSAVSASGGERLYVYDTRRGFWHIEDGTGIRGGCRHEGELLLLTDGGEIISVDGTSGEEEEHFPWYAEFGDFTQGDPNKKGVSKLQIRFELSEGAWMKALLRFDSSGDWIQTGEELHGGGKRSCYLPVVPRRCDHFSLRLEGEGGARIYSLTVENYSGSEM